MKQFLRKRFKQLGITQAEFMQKIGVKRDLHTKRNTMENKFRDLNEFVSPLNCKVIIALKTQNSERGNNYEQVYPPVD